jgi:hypothetical protein
MQVDYLRADDPDTVIATARWNGAVQIETDDEIVRGQLERAYRPTPVVVDDGAYRRLGTSGEVMIQPGDLEWFRAVSQVRAAAATGLVARLVPGITEGGYDPAAGYRTFEATIERLSQPGD